MHYIGLLMFAILTYLLFLVLTYSLTHIIFTIMFLFNYTLSKNPLVVTTKHLRQND